MEKFIEIRLQKLQRRIITDFILGKFDTLVDRLLPGLEKLNKGEPFYFDSNDKEIGYSICDLPKDEIFAPKGETKDDRKSYLISLWKQNIDCVKKLISHHSKLQTLGTAFFIYDKAVNISTKVCGLSDLYVLFNNCKLDDLKADILKLDLHYIDYSVSNIGKDNDFISRRTIKNLNSVRNLINKAIIYIGLGITDITLIDQNIIIEEYCEKAYSPSVPKIEYNSRALQQRLYERVLELMLIFKSSGLSSESGLFKLQPR